MSEEFYIDEFPHGSGDGSGNWGGTGGGGGSSGGGSGSWGGTGGWGGEGGGATDDPWRLLGRWTPKKKLVLRDGRGMVFRCGNRVLAGRMACLDLTIYCQIDGDASGAHRRCLILTFTADSMPETADWLSALLGGSSALLTIKAKWQRGHYDINVIKRVRFRLFDTVTDWFGLTIDDPASIFRLELRNGQLKIAG